jgi:uncharacterized protein
MTKTTITVGDVKFDAAAYGSQGSAILGIRDSGKTYTAMLLAERLFDAGIPFIAFDAIGVWRFIRVPGAGRGYPVVVAGGQDGDLPLTVASAPEIVRAAMANGVSLVIDLFDINLSKADWKRIVMACVRVLLHENGGHGLRHIFIEEAAEFAPQRVGPDQGQVYAEIEKLARMGGNSRLGYTLINQRAEEVNKAVLELCDNLFLHRQKGRNSLTALSKWLDIGNVASAKEIIATLSTLPTGQCWAWLAGSEDPVLVKVPAKQSLHPDRRVMRGDSAVKTKAVDVGAFVATMRSSLGKIEEEAQANDPAKLKRTIAELQKQIASNQTAKVNTPDPKAIEAAERRGYERGDKDGWANGYNDGWRMAVERYRSAISAIKIDMPNMPVDAKPAAPAASLVKPLKRPETIALKTEVSDLGGQLTGPQQTLLNALAWWEAAGHSHPTRPMVAGVCGWSVTSGHLKNVAGSLKSAGLVDFPVAGTLSLTPEGSALAVMPGGTLVERLSDILSGPQRAVFDALSDGAMGRGELAARLEWSTTSGHLKNIIGSLKTLDLVAYPAAGIVERTEWTFQ